VATLDPAIGYDWQNWSMIKSLFDGLMDYVPGTTTLRPGSGGKLRDFCLTGWSTPSTCAPGSSSTTGAR
jgi:hypothetical protein